MESRPGYRVVWLTAAAILASGWGVTAALGQSFSTGVNGPRRSRPQDQTNTLNRLGFQRGIGSRQAPPRPVSRSGYRPGYQAAGGGALGGYGLTNPLSPQAYSTTPYGMRSRSTLVHGQTGTQRLRGFSLDVLALNQRRPRGQFQIGEVPMSQYLVATDVADLPFSREAAIRGSADITAVGGGTAQDRGYLADMFVEDPDSAGEDLSLDEALYRRISWRREMLINKARAEFGEQNYQRAFSQFVLADRIEGPAEKNPKRLVVLSSIAAGNYSRGALELALLMGEDPELFTDPYYGVDFLYSDPGTFVRHVDILAGVKDRNDGEMTPWLLYAYALWLLGETREANLAAEFIIHNVSEPSLVAAGESLLAGIRGEQMQGSQVETPPWLQSP